MNTIDDARLAEIAARADAATPGPWTLVQRCGPDDIEVEGPLTDIYNSDHAVRAIAPDAAFIACARTDVPLLLDEVKRLRTYESALEISKADVRRLQDAVTRLRGIVAAVEALRDDPTRLHDPWDAAIIDAALGKKPE